MTQPLASTHSGSVVDRAAEALRVLSLESADGTFLGSEDDMIARLDVSRATLRQAASRVAQENFIAVRRGVGGGYFSARPNTMNVTRMAAQYLRARDADFTEITHGIGPLKAELAVLATRNRDPALLAKQARIVPKQKDDEVLGYKLYGIRRGSLPKLLGLKNGDMITAVNGEELKGMDKAMALYTKLRRASNLSVSIERKGQTINKEIQIQ